MTESPVEENLPLCPFDASFLPEAMRRHVDPTSPPPLRMMAARALVPLSAADTAQVLFMLTFDPDAGIRDAALKSALALQDRIASSAFRDEEMAPTALGWFLSLYAANDAYAEMLILNGSCPDTAVAGIAQDCSRATATIIGQNQLRILREPDLIRRLALNPQAAGALIDGVCDFAVRSGVSLADVPQMQAASIRLFGTATPPVEDEVVTADAVIAEISRVGVDGVSLYHRISKMSVAQRIMLAMKGNKECRDLLIRDSNRLVAVATVRSPMFTESEAITQAANKLAYDEVLRVILANREWMRKYPMKLTLVKNPKVPQGVSMRLLGSLREGDVRVLARDKNVPSSIQSMARKLVDKKSGGRN